MALSPYFAALARQKRICPKCKKRALHIRENKCDPNLNYEECECGYIMPLYAPPNACIDREVWLKQRAEQEKKPRIIRPDWNRGDSTDD